MTSGSCWTARGIGLGDLPAVRQDQRSRREISMTSDMSCSTSRTVSPRSRIRAMSRARSGGLPHVEAGGGLVEQQQRRLARRGPGRARRRAAARRRGWSPRRRRGRRGRGSPGPRGHRSRTSRSSRQVHGRCSMPARNPARLRTCRPTMTFSSTVMRGKSRMFWKVRAMPRAATSCGGLPVDGLAPEGDGAGVGREEARDQVEERGLAGAVRADDRLDGALLAPAKLTSFTAWSAAEALRDPADLEEGVT